MRLETWQSSTDRLANEGDLLQVPGRVDWLVEQVGVGMRVLDIGCRGGSLSRKMLDCNNRVWALEPNPAAALAAEKAGIQVTVGDPGERLPFENEFFDVVHVAESLETVFDTKEFMYECSRVLKRRGVLLFSVMNLNRLENRIRMLQGRTPRGAGAFPEDHGGERIRHFNEVKVRELCQETGWRIESVRSLPVLRSKGAWLDRSLMQLSRLTPGLGALLLVRALKTTQS